MRTLRERTRREAEDAERRCKEQQQDAIRKCKEEEEAAAKAEQHKARYAELLQKAADIRERVERARHASPAASCSTEQGTRRSRAACDHDVDGAAGGADARVRRPSAPERDALLAERERRAAELAQQQQQLFEEARATLAQHEAAAAASAASAASAAAGDVRSRREPPCGLRDPSSGGPAGGAAEPSSTSAGKGRGLSEEEGGGAHPAAGGDGGALTALAVERLARRVLQRRGGDPRLVLGLGDHEARSNAAVRKRYLRLSRRLHPDKTQHPLAREAFLVVQAAFRLLWR